MAKFSCLDLHVVNIYRSREANSEQFLNHLDILINNCDTCYIVGDLNINYHINHNHPICEWLLSREFTQLVQKPTHEGGGLIDHVYSQSQFQHNLYLHWPYYSHHAATQLIMQNANLE